MAYKIFPTDKYIKEIKQKIAINNETIPSIQEYYKELRTKQVPTIQELPSNPDENQIRNIIRNELSSISTSLNSQDISYIIETLSKSNDLLAFYKYAKSFINHIKDIRGLNSSFLLQLWAKFKSNLIIEAEETPLSSTSMTVAKYEKLLQNKKNKLEELYKEEEGKKNLEHYNKLNSFLHKQEKNKNLIYQSRLNKANVIGQLNTNKYSKLKNTPYHQPHYQPIYPEVQESLGNLVNKIEANPRGLDIRGYPLPKLGRPAKLSEKNVKKLAQGNKIPIKNSSTLATTASTSSLNPSLPIPKEKKSSKLKGGSIGQVYLGRR
jgi:hypothetical protein